MRRFLSLALAALLLWGLRLPALGAEAEPVVLTDEISVSGDYDWDRLRGQNITLNVYNWGQYISGGDSDSTDVLGPFQDLTGIRVNYTTFDTNESLYAKLKSGGASYDVIFPSEYMLGKMDREGMLAELNMDNIPNFSLIGEDYRGWDCDPENKYSVPYTWGTIVLIYNTTMVEEPPTKWADMWDVRCANNILMFNNSRDAYAIAAKKLGMSMNPTSVQEVTTVMDELKRQKELVQAYVMDEIFDKMEGGEAAMAPYYAGDAITMMAEQPDLACVHPEEGFNYFMDSMCIPAGARNKEAAEIFINYMCEPDVAKLNIDYIGYSTPIPAVWEMLDDELKYNPIAYPDAETMARAEVFTVLPEEINAAMDAQWSEMKSYDAEGSGWMVIVALLLALALSVFNIWRKVRRKWRDNY